MREVFYRIPGAPKLALVTDFHNTRPEPVLRSLAKQRPELIAIAGDVIFGSRPEGDLSPLTTQENVLPLLRGCAEIAPCFFSLGNHELFFDAEDVQSLTSLGITVLDNRWVEHNGLVIGGLSSAYVTSYRRFLATLSAADRSAMRYPTKVSVGKKRGLSAEDRVPETAWLRDYAAQPGYKLLLCHHPEYIAYVPENVDLILSGHAHGGQIRLFGHGLFSPGQGLLPRRTRGLYDGRHLVSAGLANTTRMPRLFNPPEICYVNL